MTGSVPLRATTVRANDLEFGLLEAGSGPLALCLHGFGIPADGAYQVGALVADAVALHQVLGGDKDAVLIGHDFGAEAAYGAAAYAPDRWRRVVTLAVPPAALDPVLFSDYEQLRRFFYLFMFRDPLGFADAMVARDGMSFLDKLWLDWSPGYQPGDHLAQVKECLREPANLAAALGYYRATGVSGAPDSAAGAAGNAGAAGAAPSRYAAEQQAAGRQPPQPTLYLHGATDGCIGIGLARRAERLLAPSSRMVVIEDAGHFLQLEKPAEVNEHILAWVSS
jgi:pimeloyl-ACP methyl ester carboxylesterase